METFLPQSLTELSCKFLQKSDETKVFTIKITGAISGLENLVIQVVCYGLVTKLYTTLLQSMDCSPRLLCPWDFQFKE